MYVYSRDVCVCVCVCTRMRVCVRSCLHACVRTMRVCMRPWMWFGHVCVVCCYCATRCGPSHTDVDELCLLCLHPVRGNHSWATEEALPPWPPPPTILLAQADIWQSDERTMLWLLCIQWWRLTVDWYTKICQINHWKTYPWLMYRFDKNLLLMSIVLCATVPMSRHLMCYFYLEYYI